MIDWATLVMGPCVRIFGEALPIVYVPAFGLPFTIPGIFDESYRPIDPLAIEGIDPMNVTTEQACLGIKLADLPVAPAQGDLLTARGVQYYVREVQLDGKGAALLVLNKQKGQR